MPFWILLGAFMKWNCTSHGRRCCDSYYWQWSVWSNWGDFISFSTKMNQFIYQIFFVLRAWRIFFDFRNKIFSSTMNQNVNGIFKVPDVSDKIEMDVRVVELIEFPPTEFTISNIFRGSFWALESIIFSWYFCRMKKYFILNLIQKCVDRPGVHEPKPVAWTKWFMDSEWFLLVDIFCTVLLLVLLQSAIKSEINGRFSGLVWKQPSIIFRRPSVIKQPTSNWRYSPLLTFCRVS